MYRADNSLAAIASGSSVTWWDASLADASPTVTNVSGANFYDIAASTSDGTDVYVLLYDDSTAIARVTSSGSDPIAAARNAVHGRLGRRLFVNHFSNFLAKGSDGVGGSRRERYENGSNNVGRLDKSGSYQMKWVNPSDDENFSYALAVGDSLLTTYDFDCSYGVGAPVMKQSVDGTISAVALDASAVMRTSRMRTVSSTLPTRVASSCRSTRAKASSTVVAARPALQVPYAFATDGTSFFVAVGEPPTTTTS